MTVKTYCTVSGVLFSLVALAHLARVIYGIPAQVGDYSVPMAISWVAFIVPGALAAWAFRLASG